MFKLTPTHSKEIDTQHQRLVDCMNQLHDEIEAGLSKPDIVSALDLLLYYSETHFAYEEKGMAHVHYPDENIHVIQHQTFIIKIKEIRERISHDSTLAVTETLIYLRKWLLAHIENEDVKYVQFLSDKVDLQSMPSTSSNSST